MLILLIKFKFTIVGQGKSIIGTYHLKIFYVLKILHFTEYYRKRQLFHLRG